jgi:hypothetical protein
MIRGDREHNGGPLSTLPCARPRANAIDDR